MQSRLTRLAIASLAALCVVASFAPIAAADPPPKGTEWTEYYFPSSDGINTLHADVLRPKGMGDKKTPVILTVSPYTNHAGVPGATAYDPVNAEGPSNRFFDFLDVGDVIERGYTYVMVDLPGFGGSSGCNDWGGVREQTAVVDAVEWAASQKWSTGKVGLMGKSYDGWTGLMGAANKPKGLAAVLSMEPVYNGYDYMFTNGVRRFQPTYIGALFDAIDAAPGSIHDDPMYNVNGAPQAWCYGVNVAMQQQDDREAAFWQERDLFHKLKNATIPVFLTQGFLESNTVPDDAFKFWSSLDGTKHRAWFPQMQHWRGWEQNGSGDYYTGRDGFADEMMRFFDQYVKGVDTAVEKDPTVAVQDILGRYRAEKSWPPSDMKVYASKLNVGTYRDDRSTNGSGTGAKNGLWSISAPLPYDAWLAGEPSFSAEVDAAPRANIAVNVYDIAPDGRAFLISRGTSLLRGAGAQEISFVMYGQDYPIPKGHHIAVLISGSNEEWWDHIPTMTNVTVASAKISLPFLTYDRTKFIKSKVTPDLNNYLATAFGVADDVIKEGSAKFTLPPKLKRR